MPRTLLPCVFFLAVLARSLCGHAPPIPIPVPPFHVEGNRLVDSAKLSFLLRGVNLPGLETGATEPMTQFRFPVIRRAPSRLQSAVLTGRRLASGTLSATVNIAGRTTEILYFGEAPGLVGVTQINARVPAKLTIASTEAASVVLTVGGTASRTGVTFWVK